MGIERYLYTSNGWIIETVYSVTPTLEYRINANYSATWSVTIGVPCRIVWEGIYRDERIMEKSFVLISKFFLHLRLFFKSDSAIIIIWDSEMLKCMIKCRA